MGTIVVGVDGSAASKAALRWALDDAKARGASRVLAVMAWSYPMMPASPFVGAVPPIPVDEIEAATTARLAETIAEVCTDADVAAGVTVDTQVECGSAATLLIEASKSADEVVVGTRGLGGFTGLMLGSVSHQVAMHAGCPVVIVPDPERGH